MISRFGKTAAVLSVIVLALAPAMVFAQADDDTARIEVDFSKPIAVKSPIGFYMGMSKDAPPDSVIKPLKPALMRGGIENADRAIGLGARYDFILSESWGYPGDNFKGHGAPYRIWEAWDEFVTDIARKYKDKPVIWEIWNQPDVADYWAGTKEQFFQLYSRTYKILRKELGSNALIAGPSLSKYDAAYLTQFLEYCSAQTCEVNVLTWRETGTDDDILSVRAHLSEAKRSFIDNQDYQHMKIKELHVIEFGGDAAKSYPGEQLVYLHSLEQGGAAAACRACWKDFAGENTCQNNTLDGLLTKVDFKPTAVWWTYKSYADCLADRVAVDDSLGRVVVIASKSSDRPKCAQVLVGVIPAKKRATIKALSVNLKHVDSVASVPLNGYVEAEWKVIPNSGEAEVAKLRSLGTNTYRVKAGSVTIPLNGLDTHSVYVLTFK